MKRQAKADLQARIEQLESENARLATELENSNTYAQKQTATLAAIGSQRALIEGPKYIAFRNRIRDVYEHLIDETHSIDERVANAAQVLGDTEIPPMMKLVMFYHAAMSVDDINAVLASENINPQVFGFRQMGDADRVRWPGTVKEG